MGDFSAWLGAAPASPETALTGHRRSLISILSTTAMAALPAG